MPAPHVSGMQPAALTVQEVGQVTQVLTPE